MNRAVECNSIMHSATPIWTYCGTSCEVGTVRLSAQAGTFLARLRALYRFVRALEGCPRASGRDGALRRPGRTITAGPRQTVWPSMHLGDSFAPDEGPPPGHRRRDVQRDVPTLGPVRRTSQRDVPRDVPTLDVNKLSAGETSLA
jgi:hypothetical protein